MLLSEQKKEKKFINKVAVAQGKIHIKCDSHFVIIIFVRCLANPLHQDLITLIIRNRKKSRNAAPIAPMI